MGTVGRGMVDGEADVEPSSVAHEVTPNLSSNKKRKWQVRMRSCWQSSRPLDTPGHFGLEVDICVCAGACASVRVCASVCGAWRLSEEDRTAIREVRRDQRTQETQGPTLLAESGQKLEIKFVYFVRRRRRFTFTTSSLT